MADARDHWENVYQSKAETAVSWHQLHCARSLKYISDAAAPATPIIDVGGGASTLVDDLLLHGYEDVTVLDVSAAALEKAKKRLSSNANKVNWLVGDVTHWQPSRQYGVWHDRAVFHFLTTAADQNAYIAALLAGTALGSAIVMSTFALDGPEKCSGLPVQRYSPHLLAARLGPPFVLVDEATEIHRTPWGSEQQFIYAVLRRRV